MRNLVIGVMFIFLSTSSLFAQVKKVDQLEMLYAQGHYKIVVQKANILMNNPEYDAYYSPKFYKSMALLQLLQIDKYYKRNEKKLEDARVLFNQVKTSPDGAKLLAAHMYEVASLKRDMSAWLEDLKRLGNTKKFDLVQAAVKDMFDKIPDIEEGKVKPNDVVVGIDATGSAAGKASREAMLKIAQTQLGVPYRYAGEDSKGFDCSGFVTYVMKSQDKDVPRRAVEQYEKAKKIKQKQAQAGDLVFFDSGSGINHVGIIVSNKDSLIMIHASSSKGIVITDVDKTDYWKKRVAGFGTFVE